MGVPKFLNRCLGLTLPKQKLLTEHFLKHLENEITTAKRAGDYDLGIQNISGHSIALEKPRSFCFRGLEAKAGQVLLYKVKVDRGMNSETALEMYNEAKASEVPTTAPTATSANPWYVGRQYTEIASGFYIDDRSDIYKEALPIFLVINQGQSSVKCVVVRPNQGKWTCHKNWFKQDYLERRKISICTDLSRATDMWRREFNLADRPSSEQYQRYCPGRHDETFVFGGNIVPVLNKILLATRQRTGLLGGPSLEGLTMPSIVRVEPSGKSQEASAEAEVENGSPEGGEDAMDAAGTESSNSDDSPADPAVGSKVALDMLGSSLFRGKITEVSI